MKLLMRHALCSVGVGRRTGRAPGSRAHGHGARAHQTLTLVGQARRHRHHHGDESRRLSRYRLREVRRRDLQQVPLLEQHPYPLPGAGRSPLRRSQGDAAHGGRGEQHQDIQGEALVGPLLVSGGCVAAWAASVTSGLTARRCAFPRRGVPSLHDCAESAGMAATGCTAPSPGSGDRACNHVPGGCAGRPETGCGPPTGEGA